MIHVSISEKSDRKISVSVDGHAGAAPMGQDIVCSAASILIYTWAQIVCDMYERGMLENSPKISLKSGSAGVTICFLNCYHEEVKQKFAVIKTGYKLLTKRYPQYVEVLTDSLA